MELSWDVEAFRERGILLEEAYRLAERYGALPPLPRDMEDWLKEVRGIQMMRECLALWRPRCG